MTVSVTLPLSPSANRYWRTFRGHNVVSKEAKDYKALVFVLARQAGITPRPGDVAITMRFHFIRVTGDLDNRIKVLGDALNGVAFWDDRQIVEIHAYKEQVPMLTSREKREGKVREGWVDITLDYFSAG